MKQDYSVLIEKGQEHLDNGDFKNAIKIGKELENMGCPDGYEIQAEAYTELDQEEEVIKILKKGIKVFQESPRFLEMLGDFKCDLGHYEEAIDCYEDALKIKSSDAVSLLYIYYNYALSLNRVSRIDEAIQKLKLIISDPDFTQTERSFIELCYGLLIDSYNKHQSYDEAVQVFNDFIAKYDDKQHGEELPYLYTKFMTTLVHIGKIDKVLDLLASLPFAEPGLYETQAEICEELNKTEEAVKILEQGIKIFKESWSLWELLGNYNSDLGNYEKAIDCYENGLNTEDPNKLALYYNYASVLSRLGKTNEALEKLELITKNTDLIEEDVGLLTLCNSLLINLHNKLKNYDRAIEIFNEFATKHQIDQDEYNEELSSLYTSFAFALWKLGYVDEALEVSLEAVFLNQYNVNALSNLRGIRDNGDYQKSKYMRILIHSNKLPSKETGEGFYVSYDVVADNEEEAFEFIMEFELQNIRENIKIEEIEILEAPKQPKGVYSIGPYHVY